MEPFDPGHPEYYFYSLTEDQLAHHIEEAKNILALKKANNKINPPNNQPMPKTCKKTKN